MANNSISDLFIKEAIKTESVNFTEIAARLSDKRTIRLLHAAMGLSTEANEFLDAMKKWIFYGKELDLVNIAEELGDGNWYEAVAIDEIGKSFDEILIAVIQKLRKRYHNMNFNEEAAINRNLKVERTELEKVIDLATRFDMGANKAIEVIKQELEYDIRQNESVLEYGTEVHQQLEERLKLEEISNVKIESSESNLHEIDRLQEFGKNFGIGDKVNNLSKLFENNERITQELKQTIANKVKLEIIDAPVTHWLADVDRLTVLCTSEKPKEGEKYTLEGKLVTCHDCLSEIAEISEE